MTSLKTANRRVGSLFAVAALVLATITPGLVPAFASAAQLAERSVALSSSTKATTGVEYTIKFTTVTAADAVVVDFCKGTPLVGAACTDPVGLSVASVTTPTAGFTIAQTTAAGDDAVVLTGDVDGAIEVAIAGVTNPTAAGTVYARIVSYDTEAHALAYQSTALGSGVVDQGGAAFSITDSIGVSGAVLETMTFCVAGEIIDTGNCVGANLLDAPTLKLGQGTGDVKALDSSNVSTGSIFAQLSTNASSGAVVNLKSSTAGCGGLVRAGAANCDIQPAGTGGVAANQAKFGAQVVGAANPATGATPTGTLRAAGDSPYYNDSVFKLNFVALNASGITSPYGDPFLDTDDAPVSDKNVQITFGASVTNQTPAGLYSADLSLIATGKF